jgi:hypothetical protein
MSHSTVVAGTADAAAPLVTSILPVASKAPVASDVVLLVSRQTLGQTPGIFDGSTGMLAAIMGRARDREERQMPLFMDVHNIEGGVSAADVASAHEADLATQGAHGVNYQRYWVDEEAGKIFCLVEAPDAEAANTVHRQAHGLVADEIYPVTEHG